MVCEHFGIDTASYSFAYVTSWSGEEGPKIVKQVGAVIQKAAREIIERVEPDKVKEKEPQSERRQGLAAVMGQER